MLLVKRCKGMMASESYHISLFTNEQIKDLREYNNALSVLWKLSVCLAWSSHSILRELVSFCCEALKLLDEFDSKLDHSQPISLCPLPLFSSTMILDDDRVYTLLAIRCNKELYDCTLGYVYKMQSMLIKKCGITQHCLQLLAVRSNPTVFYWTIPNCVVDLITSTVREPAHSEYFYSREILEVLVYPELVVNTGSEVSFGPLIFIDDNQRSGGGTTHHHHFRDIESELEKGSTIHHYPFHDTESELKKLQEKALHRCHANLRDKLNLTEIIPFLDQQDLLTGDDTHCLWSKSPAEGVAYLISILPTKRIGWWDKLIDSLERSASGTGHHDLAKCLEKELTLIFGGADTVTTNGNADSDTEQLPVVSDVLLEASTAVDHAATTTVPVVGSKHPSRSSTHTASKITESMCKFGVNPFLFSRRPDIAEFTVEKLKDELDEVKYKYDVIVNHVKLIELHELLIDKSFHFSCALSDVLQLYVNHFKSKKKANNSLLSQSELEMIQIIEAVTECTDTIDMDEEKQSWEKCLGTMREQLSNLKKTLYTINTDEMVKQQRAWSLSSEEEEKKAQEWINERSKVIQTGKECLNKLENISKGKNQSEVLKTIHLAVQRRIEVGELCLEAWINWINHRTILCK